MSYTYALIVECAEPDEAVRRLVGRAADEAYSLHPRLVRAEFVASRNDFMEPVLRFVTPDDMEDE